LQIGNDGSTLYWLSHLTKTQWKNMIDKNINQYWMKHMLGEKENKSNLKFMSKTLCQFGKQHSTSHQFGMNEMNLINHISCRLLKLV
jgi:hypothetical protein